MHAGAREVLPLLDHQAVAGLFRHGHCLSGGDPGLPRGSTRLQFKLQWTALRVQLDTQRAGTPNVNGLLGGDRGWGCVHELAPECYGDGLLGRGE